MNMTTNNQALQPLVTQQYEGYKDSGVEWLGQVPEHWAIKRLKDISPIITTGGTPSEEYFVETGYKWHTPSDFLSSFYLLSAQKNVTKSIKSKIYPANSILIVSIGATLGKVGISLEKFSANQQINIVYPASVFNTLFLVYFLSISTKTMKALSNTSTIGIMNQSKTGQIFIPFPPLSEQTAIADYLDQKTAQIDSNSQFDFSPCFWSCRRDRFKAL
jgi:type I restriction enzyme S subunit